MAGDIVPAPETQPAQADQVDQEGAHLRQRFGVDLPKQAGDLIHLGIELAQLPDEEAECLPSEKQKRLRKDMRRKFASMPGHLRIARDIAVAKIKGDSQKPTMNTTFGVLIVNDVKSEADWLKAAQAMLEKDRAKRRNEQAVDVEVVDQAAPTEAK